MCAQIADLLRICRPVWLPQPIVERIKPCIEQLGRQTKSLLLDEVKAQSSRIVETLEAEGAPLKLVLKVVRLYELDGAVGLADLGEQLPIHEESGRAHV